MILVIDIGTTVLKSASYDPSGDCLGRAAREIFLAERGNPQYHEVDAHEWIAALRGCVEELGSRNLEAVAVSGNGPTLVPVGPDGMPLDFAMTWLDRRGAEESREISESAGIYIDPAFYLPKAYWIYRNRPRIYETTEFFTSCPEYVTFLLTGNKSVVLPVPEYKPYIWTEEMTSGLGMAPGKFPDLIRPGTEVGKTSPRAKELFGLPEGVPVFSCGPDFAASLIGTATTAPGRACDRAGTSEGVNVCTDTLIRDDRLLCMSHIVEGLYNISGPIATTGKALQWFKEITGRKGTDYEDIFAEVAETGPACDGLIFLPYLTGERAPLWDPAARGCFIGLSLQHGRKEMTRAVVESVGYAVRHVLEAMEDNGLEVEELRITGSQAKSRVWNQIKADITGKRILVPETSDSELLGDLCFALAGLGEFDTVAEAAETTVRFRETLEPDPVTHDLYREYFEVYREAYGGLKNVFQRLSSIKRT
jgi:xylulokinase